MVNVKKKENFINSSGKELAKKDHHEHEFCLSYINFHNNYSYIIFLYNIVNGTIISISLNYIAYMMV